MLHQNNIEQYTSEDILKIIEARRHYFVTLEEYINQRKRALPGTPQHQELTELLEDLLGEELQGANISTREKIIAIINEELCTIRGVYTDLKNSIMVGDEDARLSTFALCLKVTLLQRQWLADFEHKTMSVADKAIWIFHDIEPLNELSKWVSARLPKIHSELEKAIEVKCEVTTVTFASNEYNSNLVTLHVNKDYLAKRREQCLACVAANKALIDRVRKENPEVLVFIDGKIKPLESIANAHASLHAETKKTDSKDPQDQSLFEYTFAKVSSVRAVLLPFNMILDRSANVNSLIRKGRLVVAARQRYSEQYRLILEKLESMRSGLVEKKRRFIELLSQLKENKIVFAWNEADQQYLPFDYAGRFIIAVAFDMRDRAGTDCAVEDEDAINQACDKFSHDYELFVQLVQNIIANDIEHLLISANDALTKGLRDKQLQHEKRQVEVERMQAERREQERLALLKEQAAAQARREAQYSKWKQQTTEARVQRDAEKANTRKAAQAANMAKLYKPQPKIIGVNTELIAKLRKLRGADLELLENIITKRGKVRFRDVRTLINKKLDGSIIGAGNGGSHKRVKLNNAYCVIQTMNEDDEPVSDDIAVAVSANETGLSTGGIFRPKKKRFDTPKHMTGHNLEMLGDLFIQAGITLQLLQAAQQTDQDALPPVAAFVD